MLHRIIILKIILHSIDAIFNPIRKWVARINIKIQNLISHINAQEFVLFTKGNDIAGLNKAMQYINKNEHSKNLKIVTVIEADEKPDETLNNKFILSTRNTPVSTSTSSPSKARSLPN